MFSALGILAVTASLAHVGDNPAAARRIRATAVAPVHATVATAAANGQATRRPTDIQAVASLR